MADKRISNHYIYRTILILFYYVMNKLGNSDIDLPEKQIDFDNYLEKEEKFNTKNQPENFKQKTVYIQEPSLLESVGGLALTFSKHRRQFLQQQFLQEQEMSCKKDESRIESEMNSPKIGSPPTQRILQKCVGLLRSEWLKKKGSIELIGYATAFAISPRIIITCASDIFDCKRQRNCDKAYFIPVNGPSKDTDVYETEDVDFLRHQGISPMQKYCYKPLRQDMAVLILKRPLHLKSYLILADTPMQEEEALQIWGYSRNYLEAKTPLVGTIFQRVDLCGHFKKESGDKDGNYVLVHTMETQNGHSGSPILREADNGKSIEVVGIHSHRGYKGTNQGLLMTSELKKLILIYALQLCKQHKQLEGQNFFSAELQRRNLQDLGKSKQLKFSLANNANQADQSAKENQSILNYSLSPSSILQGYKQAYNSESSNVNFQQVILPSNQLKNPYTIPKDDSLLPLSLLQKQFEEKNSNNTPNNHPRIGLQHAGRLQKDLKENCSFSLEVSYSQQESYSQMMSLQDHCQIDSDPQKDKLASCVGMIKCIWKHSQKNQEKYYTAFAISSKVIVTCAHSIYDQNRKKYCDKVQFYPIHGKVISDNVYESQDHDFYRVPEIFENQKYEPKFIDENVGVIILKDSSKKIERCFEFSSYLPRKNSRLLSLGYSTSQLAQFQNQKELKRSDLWGKLSCIKDQYILVHTMETQEGHDGGPILAWNSNLEQFQVLGIHTHKGQNGKNEGLLVNFSVREKIYSYAVQLCRKHNSDDLGCLQRQKRKAQLKNSVGVIRCRNSQGKLSYATGFMLSARLVVTCAHGIFDSELKEQYQQISFLDSYQDSKKVIDKMYQKIKGQQSYREKPMPLDVAVLVLEKPLEKHQYFCLAEQGHSKRQNKLCQVWGYSYDSLELNPQKVYRKDLQGQVLECSQTQSHILAHSIQTQKGHSGSPILSESQEVIGIHTHGQKNSGGLGLLMDKCLTQKIKTYAIELCKKNQLVYQISRFINYK